MQGCNARELIWRCARQRDFETWEEFQKRYERWLTVGVNRTLVRYEAKVSQDDRADLLQEVYCRLLENDGQRLLRCRGEVEASVVVYLARIAESVVVDHLRSRGAAKRGRDRLVEIGEHQTAVLEQRIADCRHSPEQQMLWRERREWFLARCRRILAGRPTARRDFQILYLALFEGWTSREISARTESAMTPSAIDSLIHRLKRRLSEFGIDLPRR